MPLIRSKFFNVLKTGIRHINDGGHAPNPQAEYLKNLEQTAKELKRHRSNCNPFINNLIAHERRTDPNTEQNRFKIKMYLQAQLIQDCREKAKAIFPKSSASKNRLAYK